MNYLTSISIGKNQKRTKIQENDTSLRRWVISQVFSILLCNMSRFAFYDKNSWKLLGAKNVCNKECKCSLVTLLECIHFMKSVDDCSSSSWVEI